MVTGTLKHLVTLNGRNVSQAFTKFKAEENIGQTVRTATVELNNRINTIVDEVNEKDTIIIYRGVSDPPFTPIFKGTIDGIKRKGTSYSLECRDQLAELLTKVVFYSFDGNLFPDTEAKGSDIAKTLIERFGGLKATVIDTGTLVIPRFICRGNSVLSYLQKLAGIYDYMIYYDPNDDTIHFEPKGGVTNTTPLRVGGTNGNVTGQPEWTFDPSNIVNKLIIKGAVQELDLEQSFNGNGRTGQSFTLSNIPISVKVFEGSTLKKGGVPDSTTGSYDYWVDKERKRIVTTTAWNPATGTNNVKVEYVASNPTPVVVRDAASIAKYGEKEDEIILEDVDTVANARLRGERLLLKTAKTYTSVRLKVIGRVDYEAGQQVRVIDTVNNIDMTLVINKIIKEYPFRGDTIYAGDKEWRIAEWQQHVMERIRSLEEKNQNDIDMLITTEEVTNMINVKPRFAKGFLKQGSTTTDKFIVWNKDTYVEKFYDDIFKGTANPSQPFWVTFRSASPSRGLFLTPNSSQESKSVFLGHKTISRIRFTVNGEALNDHRFAVKTTTTGSWEYLSNPTTSQAKLYSVSHTLATAGSILFWRAEIGSASANNNRYVEQITIEVL